MQVVIDIPDEDYKRIKDMPDAFNSLTSRTYKSIRNGTPLPKGHGKLVDADSMKRIDAIQRGDFNSIESIRKWIDIMPTVIEADKEAEDESD